MTHEELVEKLAKPGEYIADELEPWEAHFWHMATGVCTEAGELLDAAKKAVIYRKPLDRANVIEELGDIEFYLEGVRQGLNISRKECLDHNIEKLLKRYHSGKFNEAHAGFLPFIPGQPSFVANRVLFLYFVAGYFP